ncbi:MAG: 4-hydroxythreonine-4-phosphate dehydrogenase PdxA [Chitinophagaceae bacterium]|nr:4-hydroxythreonine-4-phosphate dehydrogenase PdxA [Chitinophagaceae bacterium]MBL0271691.1 4-hydroxythreonine-4-phosphate dehydrogenase PdxA [Chitinophagaceae bacterium]
MSQPKPIIGITCGDLNGIGIELIIKTFADSRILDHCTPVIFANSKAINFYRKSMPEINFNYQNTKDFTRISPKQVTIFNCWEEEVAINPGLLNEIGGKYAVLSLQTAVAALKQKQIDGLVTAPLHKKNVQSPEFSFTGHTPYLKNVFGVNDVVMMLCAGNFRVALVTEHVPVAEIAKNITKEKIVSKLNILNQSLQKDFGIDKPRIAVLGLNPHAGDEGLVGNEEETIIKPAIKEAKNNNILVVGPYSADAFFARRSFDRFDAVLAMYHDQGLIPFKALASSEGINFTAGLQVVRTSPDHGVAFDIAGKDKADNASFLSAVFECIDIINRRNGYMESRSNPLRKVTPALLANARDEIIEES